MTEGNVIETHDLTKRYGRFDAVRDLNLRVGCGCITGFLGRNGAGKSSTIKMLLGIIHASSGKGVLLGRDIADSRQSSQVRRHVAYVAEDKQNVRLHDGWTDGRLYSFLLARLGHRSGAPSVTAIRFAVSQKG